MLMLAKITPVAQVLSKRKYVLILIFAVLIIAVVGIGFGRSASADSCPTARGNDYFMCGYDTSGFNTGSNGDHPYLSWNNPSLSQGGNGDVNTPYKVQVGNTISLNLGYYSQYGSDPGQHVYSWANIVHNSSTDNLFGAVSTSGGDASTYFRNTCFDMVFATSSPYYNANFLILAGTGGSGSGGTVSCDGHFPCDGVPADQQPGCNVFPNPSPSPGVLLANGSGDSAAWFENSYGGGYGVNHTLTLAVQTVGNFCLRNHVAESSASWLGSASYLAAAGRDTRAIAGYNGSSGALCFQVVPGVSTPPQATCSLIAVAPPPGATEQTLVRVGDSSGHLLIPSGSSNPASNGSVTSGYTGDQNPAAYNPGGKWTGQAFLVINHSGPGGTWLYTVLGDHIEVTILTRTHSGGVWTTNAGSYSDTIYNCYHATCSLGVVGDVPGGPGNAVAAGQNFTVNATITNPNLADGAGDLPNTINGVPLQINNGDLTGAGSAYAVPNTSLGGILLGGQITIPLTFTAANGVQSQTIVAHPAYPNLFDFGTTCSATVDVYQHFTLTPAAGIDSLTDPQNPTSVIYDTSVTQQLGGDPTSPNEYTGTISSNVHSILNYLPVTGGSSTVSNVPRSGSYGNASYQDTWPPPPATNPNPVQPGDQYCPVMTIDNATGWIGPGGEVGGTPATDNGGCMTVVSKPYFKVYGSGITAGGAYLSSGSCTAAGNGVLASWNDDSGTNPNPGGGGPDYGASTQLNASALGNIVGFASAQTAFGRSPTDLSFANSGGVVINTNPSSPTLGGSFGGSHCLTAPVTAGTTVTNSLPTTTGDYTHSGNLSLSAGNIPVGQNVTLYVTGDVYIGGDITYQGSGGGWAVASGPPLTSNVPSFTLVATGNIYIDPSVHELDGTYSSHPTGATTGKIYTCASGFSAMPLANVYNNCANQLTVYGSFIADQVVMGRTYGSLRDETPSSPVTPNVKSPCSGNGGIRSSPRVTCAAEVFDMSPELYLAAPSGGNTTTTVQPFQAITSLPPVL